MLVSEQVRLRGVDEGDEEVSPKTRRRASRALMPFFLAAFSV
jgi:hypothetical protein